MWETDLCCCKPKTWGCSFYCSIDETSHTDEDTLKKKKKKILSFASLSGVRGGRCFWMRLIFQSVALE